MTRAALSIALALMLAGAAAARAANAPAVIAAAPAGVAAAPAANVPALRVALTQEPGTLSPINGNLAVETDLHQFFFSGLTRYDERGRQIPDLATRVPTLANGDIAPDGRTITYHLVHNAKWHDGVPVTSADVAFTFSAIMSPKNNVVDTDPYDKILRLETPDPYTVKLVLAKPWAPVIDAFSNRNVGSIVPAHLLKDFADLNRIDFNAAPVGSGPYKFVAWHRGSDVEMIANPDYFRGAPKIGRVIVRFLTNDNTMMVALRTHELDLADRLNISTYSNIGNVPGLLPAINSQAFWEHLTFNTARSPLDDRRVRLALVYGLDIKELFAKVAHGLGTLGPTNQHPFTPWYNKKIAPYPFDPQRAAKLLDAAGWKMGADGVRVKDGKRLSLTLNYTSGNVTREQTGVILQQRWKAIGVEIAIKTYPASTFYAPAAMGGPFYGGKTDIGLSAFVRVIPDPNGIGVNDAEHMPPHGQNLSFYRNAEMSRLEFEAASTPVFAKRKALYDRIQEIEFSELPYYVLRWSEITDIRSANLIGVKPPVVGSTFWNVADWTFR